MTNNMNPVNTTVTVHVYIGLVLKAFTPDYRYGRKPSPHNCGQDIIVCMFFILVGTKNSPFICPINVINV